MSDIDPALSAAAAEVATNTPPPPAPEPEPEAVEIDENLESYPKEVVQKLRQENAKWRTRTRDIEGAFEGYEPHERERFLNLAQQLHADPEAAFAEYQKITNRLAEQLGKETTVEDQTPDPAPAPQADGPVDAAAIQQIVAEALAAEKAQAEQQSAADAVLSEAEALDDAYSTRAGKSFLLGLAQELNVDLATAHQVHQELLQQVKDDAVAEYRESLRTGQHPPRLPSGDPTAPGAQGPATTLAEARQRMEERLRSTYGE